MGLKELKSKHDLVQGTDPVGKMEQQIGPKFQRELIDASNVHTDSLKDLPITSKFQDINGIPDTKYNREALNTTPISDSPFKGPFVQENGGPDHMISLLNQSVASSDSELTYDPSPNKSQYQDLDGNPGPQFDLGKPSQVHGDPTQGPNPTELVNSYNSTVHNMQYGPVPTDMTHYQDLNGVTIPFDVGEGNPSNVHADPSQGTSPTQLVKAYNSPQGWTQGIAPGATPPSVNIGPVPKAGNFADLDGLEGPAFSNGKESTLHNQVSIMDMYNSSVNPNASYSAGQPGTIWPQVKPSELDINNNTTINESTFDKGRESSLLKDLMTQQYNGNWTNHNTFNSPFGGIKTANYSQGQPGSTWPTLNPSPINQPGLGLFADRADANAASSPSGYVHPELGNTF